MNRRGFIAWLTGVAGALPLAKAGAVLPVTITNKTILIQQSPVAGFQYHEGEDVWPQLALGDELRLIAEPGNRYDAQAVRVEWRGRMLGYVPRRDNTAVSQMLARGERLRGEISALRTDSNPWARVVFRIEMVA